MFKKTLLIAAAALLTLAAGTHDALALITLARVTPASKVIQPDRPARVTLVWSIRTTGGASVTVETDDGEIRVNGAAVDFLPALPDQTKTSAPPANFYIFTFTETVTIPLEFIEQAVKNNQPLVFRRVFTDDSFTTTTNVDVAFSFSSGIAGPLEVSRLRLAFKDGSTLCNAATGEDVTVTAFVDTEGSGVLRGAWQVRDDAQEGSFLTVRTLQIPVTAGRNVAIKSPPLPLSTGGRIDARLHVTSPALGFPEPFITCAVAGSDPRLVRREPAGRPAKVVSPRPFSPLSPETKVEWEALENVKAYRIEVLAEKDGLPVAAQEVKPGETSGKLSPLTLGKLDPDRRYIVRVMGQ